MEKLAELENRLSVLNEVLSDIGFIIEENDVKSQEEHNSLCKLLDKYYKERLEITKNVELLKDITKGGK